MKADHFTINVTDLEASMHFYGELLGLKQLPGQNMGDHQLYYFDLGGAMLELIHYDDDFGELKPHVKTRGIYRHLALSCEDVYVVAEKLKAAGVKITDGPGYVPLLKFHNILLEDPNGVELEIVQRD